MVVATSKLWLVGRRWLPLLLWMAAIFVVSDQPKSDIPAFGLWDWLVKKGSHFLAYGLLAFLAQRVTQGMKRPYVWAFVITAVYAASDEWHQSFVPTRNGRLMDVVIDCLGGITVLLLLHYQRRPSPQSP